MVTAQEFAQQLNITYRFIDVDYASNGKICFTTDRNTWSVEEVEGEKKKGKRIAIRDTDDGYKTRDEYDVNSGDFISLYLKHTQDIYCIDIDEEKLFNCDNWREHVYKELPFTKDCPFTLSRKKKMPHFYLRIQNIGNYTVETKVTNGFETDLIHRLCNMWERPDAEVYNFNGELPVMDWEQIKQYFNLAKMKFISNEEVKPKPKITAIEKAPEKDEEDIMIDNDNTSNDNILAKLQHVLSLLPDSWAIDHEPWLSVMLCCIHHYFLADEAGEDVLVNDFEDVFLEFSSRSPDYREREVKKRWQTNIRNYNAVREHITIGTLIYELKQNHPDQYRKFAAKWYRKTPTSTVDWDRLTDKTIAQRFKDMKATSIIYDKEEQAFYLWTGVIWERDNDSCHGVMYQINEFLYDHYIAEWKIYKEERESQIQNSNDDDKKEKLKQFKNYEKTIMATIKKIDTATFKKHLVEELKTAYARTATIKWDGNSDRYFAFNNKIYDLELGAFVEPDPYAYIRTTCGYDYVENKDPATRAFLEKFVRDITANNEVYCWLMKFIASLLSKSNPEQIAAFFVGKGGNGKTILCTLLYNVLGGTSGYYGQLDAGFYQQNDKTLDAGKDLPHSGLVSCKHSRCIMTEETPHSAIFDNKRFCAITGGGLISARGLYAKKATEYRAGRVIIQTNHLPAFSRVDDAIRRRIRVINFPFKFKTQSDIDAITNPETKSLCKLRDNSLPKRMDSVEIRNCFIGMMLDWYAVYRTEGLDEPKTLADYKNEYFREIDIVGSFLLGSLEDKPGSSVALNDVYEVFKETTKGETHIRSKQMFKKAIEDIGEYTIKPNNHNAFYIMGYTLRKEEEQVINDYDL